MTTDSQDEAAQASFLQAVLAASVSRRLEHGTSWQAGSSGYGADGGISHASEIDAAGAGTGRGRDGAAGASRGGDGTTGRSQRRRGRRDAKARGRPGPLSPTGVRAASAGAQAGSSARAAGSQAARSAPARPPAGAAQRTSTGSRSGARSSGSGPGVAAGGTGARGAGRSSPTTASRTGGRRRAGSQRSGPRVRGSGAAGRRARSGGGRKVWWRVLIPLLVVVVFVVPIFFAFTSPQNPAMAGPALYTLESVRILAEETRIPPDALNAYLSAGVAFPDIGWHVLAGIGQRECNHGRSTLPGCRRPTANFCGARGPMQFLGETWRPGTDSVPSGECPGIEYFTADPTGPPLDDGQGYATDGDGDGVADPWNWLDATHAAARYLKRNGYTSDERGAVRAYNDSDTYIDAVLELAAQYAAIEARLLEEGRLERSTSGMAAGLSCLVTPRGPVHPLTETHVTPATTFMANTVIACFGSPHAVSCFSPRDGRHEHPRGRACDFMATSDGSSAQGAERLWGLLMAEWVASNADVLNVSYVIWWDRIWNPAQDDLKPWAEWRDYENCPREGEPPPCTDPSNGHFNHVHVSVKLMPGDPGWAACIPDVPCVV